MRAPLTVDDARVPRKLLEDLALKTVYLVGEVSLVQLADHMKVALKIVDELFQRLRRDQLVQVTGMAGGVHQIVTTSEGKTRAVELLSLSQYAGPAPVALEDYVACVRRQTVRDMDVSPAELAKAFDELVLDAQTLDQLGTAVVSGRAIFLYGPSGTGKTTVAETLWRLFHRDPVWVPHAIVVDGQIITVYDPGVHHPAGEQPPADADRRWMLCRRPRVVVGGELTIEMLDLQFNPQSKFYVAPVQMKANNGVLIVDDFGRQRVRPEELLNRWVVPLDRNIDFLTLTGGRKIEVPFDLLVVFATNLDPATLVDEAFLRRIQTKIKLDNIGRDTFHEITRRLCRQLDLRYDLDVVDHLIELISGDLRQPLRACYPRDIVQQIVWAARYERREPALSRETVEQACRNYFLSPDARTSTTVH
jgi:predicted ATPase with chaperone activity